MAKFKGILRFEVSEMYLPTIYCGIMCRTF